MTTSHVPLIAVIMVPRGGWRSVGSGKSGQPLSAESKLSDADVVKENGRQNHRATLGTSRPWIRRRLRPWHDGSSNSGSIEISVPP
jgi:hypothetical protein